MGSLLGDFRRYMRRRNLSPLTIQHRCHQVQAFENWLRRNRRRGLLAARPHDVEAWLDSKTLSPSTRATYLSYLASFYRWGLRAGVTERNPLDLIERPKQPRRLPRPTDKRDLHAALEDADARMYAWLLLSSLQGLRVSSIARLTVEGVDRTRTATASAPR